MEPIRCKYRCTEHKEFLGYKNSVLHMATFFPVVDGSPENKAFFDATPAGKFEIGTIMRMPFQLGKAYYLDLTEAPD